MDGNFIILPESKYYANLAARLKTKLKIYDIIATIDHQFDKTMSTRKKEWTNKFYNVLILKDNYEKHGEIGVLFSQYPTKVLTIYLNDFIEMVQEEFEFSDDNVTEMKQYTELEIDEETCRCIIC